MPFDLLQRKRNHFVLWHAAITNPPPALVIGTFQAGNPPSFQLLNRFDLAPSAVSADLWEVAAAACGLVDNCVYHYWFEVTNANPKTPSPARILCTDPTASTVLNSNGQSAPRIRLQPSVLTTPGSESLRLALDQTTGRPASAG